MAPARDLIMVIYGDHVINELNSTSLRRFFFQSSLFFLVLHSLTRSITVFRSSFNEKFVNIRQLFHCFDSCSSLRPRVGEVDIKAKDSLSVPTNYGLIGNKAVDIYYLGNKFCFIHCHCVY